MEKATITNKGQATIPENISDALGLHTGDKIQFVFNDKQEVILKPVIKTVDEVFSLLYHCDKASVSVEKMDAAFRQQVRDGFQ
jgi:AbrB family looped-hinge helix DNA binding protein